MTDRKQVLATDLGVPAGQLEDLEAEVKRDEVEKIISDADAAIQKGIELARQWRESEGFADNEEPEPDPFYGKHESDRLAGSNGLGEVPTNPKKLYGDLKVPVHLVPPTAIAYLGLGFRDGAKKYGPYNWRKTKVESMTYIGATMRHLLAYLDGEYIDPESGNPHLAHAMCCMAIAADAHEGGFLEDNRPTPGPASEVFAKYALKKPEEES